MDQEQMHEKLRDEHEAARFQFISTELDLALTFCRIALSSDDTTKHKRNAHYAEQAYEVAARFLDKSDLTAHESREIQTKIASLQSLLDELQERT